MYFFRKRNSLFRQVGSFFRQVGRCFSQACCRKKSRRCSHDGIADCQSRGPGVEAGFKLAASKKFIELWRRVYIYCENFDCILWNSDISCYDGVAAPPPSCAKLMGRLIHKTADPRTNFVKEHVFGVKHGEPMDRPVMKHLWSQLLTGALVPSFALMPCLLTLWPAFADGNDMVFFEMQK